MQRYGIEQGVDEKGQIKYRCIDNHLGNSNNEGAERRQVVPMASVSHILLMTRAMHAALGPMQEDPEWDLRGATEDLKAAYRQCPLLSSQVAVAITAVWCPHGGPYCRGTVQFHEMYGQPFGAGHAVPNFCRLAEWASRVTRRLLLLVLDHFFDDYFLVEPKCLIASGIWAFRRLLELFGLAIDPGKSQLPAEVWRALGVQLDLQCHQVLLSAICQGPSQEEVQCCGRNP